ncbi:MAG: AAA family ATPase, partial [Elusimicrobia bacterium]|nr:AAA family ATPase [Elusimicrobiota bacterium]
MFWIKLKLFFQKHWIVITIVLITLISIVLPLWYLSGMEENTRRYIMGINIASMPWGILQTLIFVGFLYLLHYGGSFSSFKKAKIKSEEVNVKFTDVVGLTEAKREAWEVVQLIKDRQRVKAIGGKILKGVLLVGPPGCGKTMLAKAVAAEAGVPFLSTAGSEFVEVFVGVGASRVRKLFKQASQYAQAHGSCIVFIDELEVIGRQRILYDAFGGGSETNSTQNQLLVEMDGLSDTQANVVVFGATNAAEDILDPALLRPGRFDRKIYVGKPNLGEREKLFEYYMNKIKYGGDIDIPRLARKAVYKSPAEIENIVKEAALIAARNGKDAVAYKEMVDAIERIELGVAHKLVMTAHEKEMTAYHEAGHLVIVYLTHPTNDVFKVSILNRGGTLGVVHSIPRERPDFKTATMLAHEMVWRLGMGKDGMVGDFESIPGKNRSDELNRVLNWETRDILKEQLTEVENTLRTEWQVVERFVKEILDREELDYDEIAAIFTEYGKPPKLIP